MFGRRRTRITWSVLLALGAGELGAQGVIRGVVFDSLFTHAPLAGATVVLHGTALVSIADRRGRFDFRSLAPGRYTLGFFHPALDTLDIAAPGRIVELAVYGVETVTLAIPSANGLSLRLCGHAAAPRSSVLYGTVRGAESGEPLAGAEAVVRWFEVVVGRGGSRQLEQVARDSTGADGRYRLCGVPNDIALTLFASHEGQSTGPLHLEADTLGIGRQDVRVSRTDPAARQRPEAVTSDTGSSGLPPGRARLSVVVRDGRRVPVRRAIVGVRGTPISGVTNDSGLVTITGVPSGTQTLSVRAIGLLPVHRLVDASPQAEPRVQIELLRSAVILPAVAVVGRRPDPVTVAIDRRMRTGDGTLIEGDELATLSQMPSAWARIPGILVGPDADPLPLMRDAFGGRCAAEIWVDGVRIRNVAGWELRGLMLNAKRVEVYSSASRVPPEFMDARLDPCGVVAIWSQ